jgi:2-succinyl-5-enolpyruvyl-6-hydroxy-3-cyclohexene-1-carboxylate synthase
MSWAVNGTGEVNDTFMNLTNVIQGDERVVVDQIRFMLEQQPHPFVQLWDELMERVRQHAEHYEPCYSQMAAVKALERQLSSQQHGQSFHVHYANSTPIRLANIYARHSVYCNRGVNGIEGSLSTAAGFSCVTDENVFCVIGDLSFFYDQNALWNQNIKGNLRILLLNNGCGGIFSTLKGLEGSPARSRLVAAEHHTSAEGICQQNNVVYLQAKNMDEMQQGIDTLLNINTDRPVLLEVFTEAQTDAQVMQDYLS